MQYAIVSVSDLSKDRFKQLEANNQLIDGKDLVQMNATARIEISHGGPRLNRVLFKATDELSQKEIAAHVEAMEISNDVAIS